MQKITKGVIAIAGNGTRFLPTTKVVIKQILPIIDKPIIQLVVEEMAEAGIEEIIIVTNNDLKTVEKFFTKTEDQALLNKSKALVDLNMLIDKVKITFVRQEGHYGTATPILNIKEIVGNKPFLYAFGDDLVLSKISFCKQMIEAYEKHPGIYLGVQEVESQEVYKYGIVKLNNNSSSEISLIVEKPSIEEAPSNLAIFGRFVLNSDIFEILTKLPLGNNNELYLTDGIENLIRSGQKVYYKKVEDGKWYTTGDPVNYLEAIRAYACFREDYKDKVKNIFKEL